MNNELILFSKIAEHLAFYTTLNELNESRSVGIETYDDLATELNDTELLPKSGKWTAHALECFFSRCRKKYKREQLEEACELSVVGCIAEGYMPSSIRTKRRGFIDSDPSDVRAVIKQNQDEENVQPYDNWLKHEKEELDREFYALRRQMKNILKA